MRRLRGDRAPHQSDEYVEANYEPEDFDHRGEVSDDIRDAVRQAYVTANLLHGCSRCSGTFWAPELRDEHEGECA